MCGETDAGPTKDIRSARYNILKLHYDVKTIRQRAHTQAYILLYACIHPMFAAHWYGHSAK